jgi:Tfp pilus assembly protein PilO
MEIDISVNKEIIKKYQYSIIVAGATFIGAIILIVVISQLYTKSKQVTAEANAKTVVLDQLKEKKTILDNLKNREAELKESSRKLAVALPEDKDIGRLFIQLNGLITETGGNVQGLANGTTTQSEISENLTKYTFTIPTNFSDYQTLKTFFVKSKQALRLINISALSISSPNGGPVDASITVNAYSRK